MAKKEKLIGKMYKEGEEFLSTRRMKMTKMPKLKGKHGKLR